MSMRGILTLIVILLTVTICNAQDSIKTYMYGHSLLDHRPPMNATPSDETTVAHWLYLIAQHDNNYFAATGQYGFLRQHATNVTNSNWGYDSVPRPWDLQQEPFSDADFDNVFIAPANFIQDQAPNANYWLDTVSPLDASYQIVDWVQLQEPGTKMYVYESWPDMGQYAPTTFPPSATQFANYNTYTIGGFHQWFEEYHDSLEIKYPNQCVKMIPAGPAMSKILTMAPYNSIPLDSLYEDNAPHGRSSLYFLAGLVTYMSIYEKKAPANYQAPALVHSTFRNNYNQLVDSIWADLSSYTSLNGSRVFCTNTPLNIDLVQDANEIANRNILVYPNPAHDIVNLDVDVQKVRVSLLSMTGEYIYNKKRLVQQHLDLSELSIGQYILIIHSENAVYPIRISKF
jgi:hypothetical protein